MKKTIVSLVLSASLSAALLGGTSGAATTASRLACSGRAIKILKATGMEQVALKSFTINAKTPKSPQVGDVVKIPVLVTRPAEEDPAGQGIPMDGVEPEAAPGINVGVGLLFDDVFLPGFAVTDDNGEAIIKIKIENYVKPGPVDASFYAWKTLQDTPCARIDETGYRFYQKFFSVKP